MSLAPPAFYGWVPSIVGWLSFRSCRPFTFKGFRADCRYFKDPNASSGRTHFEAVAGKNLNDSSTSLAAVTQKLLFVVEGRRRESSQGKGRTSWHAESSDLLIGSIAVYIPSNWHVFWIWRIRSLLGKLLDFISRREILIRNKDIQEVAVIKFALDRKGNCTLRLGQNNIDQTNSDLAKSGTYELVGQAFVVLKDFFHTHIAHGASTDSGVPIVEIDGASTNDQKFDLVASKMRRRLHRKYASLIDISAVKANIYLLFLRVFIGSVGGYNFDGSRTRDNKKIPLLDSQNYSTASELLNLLGEGKRDAKNEWMTVVIGLIATLIAAIGTYFQVMGSIDNSATFLGFGELVRMNSNSAKFGMLLGGLAFITIATCLPIRAIGKKFDAIASYILGTYCIENLQNLAVVTRKWPIRLSWILYIVGGLIFCLALFKLR